MRPILWVVVLLLAFEALAQEPLVPAELLKPRRRLQGNQITFCVNGAATLYAFDRAVGRSLAETLLLEPRFVELSYTGYGLLDDGDLLSNLFVDLTNHCDGFIGFNLASGVYPDWLSFSRSYARIPYVLAVTNPEYQSLGQIPRGKAVGSGLGTSADAHFGAYVRELPEGQSWQRIPYGDFALMLRRLKEGKLEGALIWPPVLYRLSGGDPERQGFYVRATDPLKSVDVQLAIAIRAKDTSLRAMLDKAVATIIEDGTVARLLKEQNIMGSPGEAGGIQPGATVPVWVWLLAAAAVLALVLIPRRSRRRSA